MALNLACPIGVLGASGCGTDAVGIETCRSVEFARCEAALSCGLIDDVDKCLRFSRDHCLHGLGVSAVSPTAVNRCVDDIEEAGQCAKRNGKKSSPSECAERLGNDAETVCELVLEPELAPRCRFLVPPEPEPEPEGEEPEDAGSD